MLIPFEIGEIFQLTDDDFVVLTSKDLPRTGQTYQVKNPLQTIPEKMQYVLDEAGIASAKAQGLASPITSFSRFAYSNHKLFIKFEKNRMIGYIKIGVKNLIYNDRAAKLKELQPMCVLDFYVEESMQRHGWGRRIYDYMLAHEGLEPHKLAIDRPSSKFIGFMKKHFGLSSYRSQTNNFVIFDEFFETDTARISALRERYAALDQAQAQQLALKAEQAKAQAEAKAKEQAKRLENARPKMNPLPGEERKEQSERKYAKKSVFGEDSRRL